MISRAGAMGVKRLLPAGILLVVALSVILGLTLVLASNHPRVADIKLLPSTTGAQPLTMAPGDTTDFTVQVEPNGQGVAGVTLSLKFDTQYLEVVDQGSAPGVQIAPHPSSPLDMGPFENVVDNANGIILFSVGTLGDPAPSGNFPIATIRFKAKSTPTPKGVPAVVKFQVTESPATKVTARGGSPLLKHTGNFAGAWIAVLQAGQVEIFIDPSGSTAQQVEIVPNGMKEFIVKMDTHGAQVDAFTIAISFSPQFLKVVDPVTGQPATKITPDPANPLKQFPLSNKIDNGAGSILYTAGSSTPAQGLFNLARIKFMAKSASTLPGNPTMVVFHVDPVNLDQTSALRNGKSVLKDQADYPGAWIQVGASGASKITALISAPATSNEGQEVTFDGSASTAATGTSIVAYEWDFNDGTAKVTGAASVVKHTFADGPASRNVTLKITDSATPTAGTDTASHPIQVNNVAPSITSITAAPDKLPSEGGTSLVTVIASDPGGTNDPLKYSVDCNGDGDFTDGNDAADQSSNTHTCSFPSSQTAIAHSVIVKVADDDGGSSTSQKRVDQAPPGAPTADAGDDQTVNEGATVQLDGSGSTLEGGGTPSSFSWVRKSGPTVTITDANTSTPSFVAPDGPATPAVITFELTVTAGSQTNTDTVDITVRNVAPTVSVSANPATLPQGGGTSTITVNATDPAGAGDPLKYSVDCNGDGDFTDAGDVANQSTNTHTCTFAAAPAETQVVHTVKVSVDDGDNGVTPGQTTVAVGEAKLDDWTGSLNITGKVTGGGNLTGNPKLAFGIRSGCTDGFELKNSSNQDCDVSGSIIPSPDELQGYLHYPKNTASQFFDTQKLATSRIAPPSPETETLMFPVRFELSKAGATEADITIKWDIGNQTKVPTEYITVLLIDHSPESPLPPFNVTNIGKSATGEYAFKVKLEAGKATRDFTIVAARSQVQTMRLTTGPQVMSLSVKPLFGSKVSDVFKFTGANRRSVTDDPLILVIAQFVTTWNSDYAKPEDQRLRGMVFVGDPRHPEMRAGFGYLVTVAPLDGKFRDVMLIIPGEPIVENTRTSN